jgi:HPt (histidine-containing phosphotransfer) domain-containing protein
MGALKTVLTKECKKAKCANPEHVNESLKYREMLYAFVENKDGVKAARELDQNGKMDLEILRRHMKEHEDVKKASALEKWDAAVAKAKTNPKNAKAFEMERLKQLNEKMRKERENN